MKARSAVLGCFALGLSALPAISQSGGPPNHGVSTTPNNPLVTHAGNNADYSNFGLPAASPGMSSVEMARRAQLAKLFLEERNKQNASDVTKLLALAKSLNDGLAGPGLNAATRPPSEEQLHTMKQMEQLKEIEKLAGRVKHRTSAPTTLQVRTAQ